MITDLTDLEPLLGQYDPGLILVGPVLSFSIGGNRYFYIAGNGRQIYETIGLGVFEDEAGAANRRSDIIATLKNRFEKVLIYDSHWQMARVADARWPNEETARVLALASLLSDPGSDADAQDRSTDDNSPVQAALSDGSQELVDDIARVVDRADEVASAPSPPPSADLSISAAQQEHDGHNDDDLAAISRALRPPSYRSQSVPKLPAPTSSAPPSGGRVVRQRQEHSGRDDDDVAAVLRALNPSKRSRSVPRLPIAAISRALDSPWRPQRDSWLRAARPLATWALVMCVVFGASAFLTYTVLRSGASRMAHEVGTIAAPGPATMTATSSIPTQETVSNKSARLEPTPTLAPSLPALQPSGGLSIQGKTVPDSRPEQQRMPDESMQQVEPAPAATAPSPPAPQPSSGEISTQAETVPDFRPEEQAKVSQPTQKVEPAPAAIASSQPAAQPSAGVSPEAEAVPDSRLEQQAKANQATQRVEPEPAAVAPAPAPQPPVITQAKPLPDSPAAEQLTTVESAPSAMVPSQSAPQPSEGVSTQAKPAPDASPEQQAKPRVLTLRFEPRPAAIAPSQPAAQPPGAASTQAKPPAPDTRPEQPAKTAAISGPQPAPVQGNGAALGLDSEEITTFIDRGSAFLKRGDLASARLLLTRAADAGSADAALMLGSTFDPLFIQELGVIGIEPDVARARQWYQKAVELGSEAASQRLANLKN